METERMRQSPLRRAVTLVRSITYALAFYVTTALFLLICSPLLLCPRAWAMAGLKAHARACVFLLRIIAGTRLEVRGLEHLPAGAILVAAKHQSAWDTFALLTLFRDPAVVMKAELAQIPLYGWFCIKFEHIIVSRERAAVALKKLMADGRDRSAAGREILIFPEGTRSTPGAPPDYKPGVTALYEGLGIQCVPLALNSGLFWPRRSLLRHPGTIVVELLEPIPAGLDRRTFRDQLETRIEAASLQLMEEALKRDPGLPDPRGQDPAPQVRDKMKT